MLAAYRLLASALCLLDSFAEAQGKAQEEAQAEAKAKAHAKALLPFLRDTHCPWLELWGPLWSSRAPAWGPKAPPRGQILIVNANIS